MGVERRDFKLEVKALGAEGVPEGYFEGYAAVFGNEDWHGDVIEAGAFKKTLKENPVSEPKLEDWYKNIYRQEVSL